MHDQHKFSSHVFGKQADRFAPNSHLYSYAAVYSMGAMGKLFSELGVRSGGHAIYIGRDERKTHDFF